LPELSGSLDKEGFAKMAKTTTLTAGIDTSKDKLDVAIHGQPGSFVVANTEAGWASLAKRLARDGVQRVGIEATGGYQRGVARFLQAAGFCVKTLQPLQVKAFALLHLQRAKSDGIDAALIAAVTHLLGDDAKPPVDQRFDAFQDHLTFIEQIEEDIVCIKTRVEHVTDARLQRFCAADIKRLTKRRDRELTRLIEALRGHDDLAKRFDLVLSIPAIGERTATSLVVRMPELGQVSREAAASIAGLAPFVHQSGKRQGQTHIGGGRARLRRALYMPAMVGAFRWNPILKAFYARMTARGKPPKSALIACARKLLIMANAVVARGTPWQERTASA
jgi:transposase